MEIKEMPIEEKYNEALDEQLLWVAMSYAFHKEQGTVEKWWDYTVEVYRKMLYPYYKKMLAPGRSFKQTVNQLVYVQQISQPLSEIDLSWISDREAVMTFKNCDILRRLAEIVKKIGLNLDPKFHCEIHSYTHAHPRHPAKELGMELTLRELKKNGCSWTIKLI